MRPDELRAEIERVLAAEPELSSFGFGVYDARAKTPAERRGFVERSRAELLSDYGVAMVSRALGWVRTRPATKAVNKRAGTSYEMKHHAEKAAGDYVSNGALITAALIDGFKYRRLPDQSPNC